MKMRTSRLGGLVFVCALLFSGSSANANCDLMKTPIGPSAEDAIFKLQPLVDAGDRSAAYRLGGFFLNATWLERPDLRAKGLSILRELARQGSWASANLIAQYYDRGSKDDRSAFPFYLQAAKAGDALAEAWVGSAYLHGKGIDRNDDQALVWLQKAARQGISWAHYDLVKLYAARPKNAESIGWASFHLEQAARSDFSPAQIDMARGELAKGNVDGALFWSSVVRANPGPISNTKFWKDIADVIFADASKRATIVQVERAVSKAAPFSREASDRRLAEMLTRPSRKDPITGCAQ